MGKAFKVDITVCADDLRNMGDTAQVQKSINLASPVMGIDCKTGTNKLYKQYLILYRKTIVKPAGPIPKDAFTNTQLLTVYTMYPTLAVSADDESQSHNLQVMQSLDD